MGNFSRTSPDAGHPVISERDATHTNSASWDGDTREPPMRAWVTLSEALSWMALDFSMTNVSVANLLKESEFTDSMVAQSDLRRAVAFLTELGSVGTIRMRGRYVEQIPDVEREGFTRQIPAEAFHDFAHFDVPHDGLQRGHGITWRPAKESQNTMADNSPCDAYHMVIVNRAELLEYGKVNGDPPLTAPEAGERTPVDIAPAEKKESPISAKKKPGPAADKDWPDVIAKVTAVCIKAEYALPLKRGQKAAIQTMLLDEMSARKKFFSDDTARNHASTVIAALPTRPE